MMKMKMKMKMILTVATLVALTVTWGGCTGKT